MAVARARIRAAGRGCLSDEVQKLHLLRKVRGRSARHFTEYLARGVAHGLLSPAQEEVVVDSGDVTEDVQALIRRFASAMPQDSPELSEICARAVREMASSAQRIEKATRTLWALTAAAHPEKGRIRATTAEINDLKQDQQERFMQAVVEAAELLIQQRGEFMPGFRKASGQR